MSSGDPDDPNDRPLKRGHDTDRHDQSLQKRRRKSRRENNPTSTLPNSTGQPFRQIPIALMQSQPRHDQALPIERSQQRVAAAPGSPLEPSLQHIAAARSLQHIAAAPHDASTPIHDNFGRLDSANASQIWDALVRARREAGLRDPVGVPTFTITPADPNANRRIRVDLVDGAFVARWTVRLVRANIWFYEDELAEFRNDERESGDMTFLGTHGAHGTHRLGDALNLWHFSRGR